MEIKSKDIIIFYLSASCMTFFGLLGLSIIFLLSDELINISYSIGMIISLILVFIALIMGSIYAYYSIKIFPSNKDYDYILTPQIEWRRNRQFDIMLLISIMISIICSIFAIILPIYLLSSNIIYLSIISFIFFPLIILGIWIYYNSISKMCPTYVGVSENGLFLKYKNKDEDYKWKNIKNIKKIKIDGIKKWAIILKNGDKKGLILNSIDLNFLLKTYKKVKSIN